MGFRYGTCIYSTAEEAATAALVDYETASWMCSREQVKRSLERPDSAIIEEAEREWPPDEDWCYEDANMQKVRERMSAFANADKVCDRCTAYSDPVELCAACYKLPR